MSDNLMQIYSAGGFFDSAQSFPAEPVVSKKQSCLHIVCDLTKTRGYLSSRQHCSSDATDLF